MTSNWTHRIVTSSATDSDSDDLKVSMSSGDLECVPQHEIIPVAFGIHQNPVSLLSSKRFGLPISFPGLGKG